MIHWYWDIFTGGGITAFGGVQDLGACALGVVVLCAGFFVVYVRCLLVRVDIFVAWDNC